MPNIKTAVKGREMDVLKSLGIEPGNGKHINCPYPSHGGKDDWRWDKNKNRAYCTCIRGGHSIFDVVMSVRDIDFRESLGVVAGILGIDDDRPAKFPSAKAKSLMRPPSNLSRSDLAKNYLASRLECDPLMPSTKIVGWTSFPYFEAGNDKPVHVGDWSIAAFETVSADGRTHAHRIYLDEDGRGKANLGKGRDPKKSATKASPDDNVSGCSVLWGDPTTAPICIICEGIETGAAIAVSVQESIGKGMVSVAAALSTSGIIGFIPWPATERLIIAADRDEDKPKDKKGYQAGEKAARSLCIKYYEKLDMEISLPGDKGETVDFLDMMLSDGVEAVRDRLNDGYDFEPREDDRKPEESKRLSIEFQPGRVDLRVKDYEKAAGMSGAIFQRGAYLTRVARISDASCIQDIRRASGSLAMMMADTSYVRAEICKVSETKKWSAKQEAWYTSDPSIEDIRSLMASAGHWPNIKVITGITEIPVLANDGRVIDQPGHDEATGIFFDPGATKFPKIPDEPTRNDALQALKIIKHVIAGFPFIDGTAESVAISEILTPFKRPFLRSAPMFLNTAPKMGSGKTLLASVVSYIATGIPPASMSQEDNRDEEKKRMLALLMSGSAVTVIDNIEKPLKSDTLCTVLTEPVWKERILGKTEEIKVGTATTWIATGNNLQVSGDLSTRSLVCTIDPECERPEERDFKINLHEYIPAHRGEIASACLTILKAYWTAKQRGDGVNGLTTFGRFEQWSDWIREAICWLGMTDPCQTRKLVESRDGVREDLSMLLEAWHEMFDDRPQTINSVLLCVSDAVTESEKYLKDALLQVCSDGRSNLLPRKLGKYIAATESRIENGLKFVRSGFDKRAVKWAVMKAVGNYSKFENPVLCQIGVSLGELQDTENKEKVSYSVFQPTRLEESSFITNYKDNDIVRYKSTNSSVVGAKRTTLTKHTIKNSDDDEGAQF